MRKFLALALVAVILAAVALPMSAKANESVEALYFETAPKIDGVISEEEWGEPTVSVKGGQATTYQHAADVKDNTMDLWLRWDADYMYVGVKTPDTDGQSLQAGEGSNWNGDVIQFRFDPWGANSSGDSNAPFSTHNAEVTNVSAGYLTNDKKENVVDHAALIADPNASVNFKFGQADGVFTYEVAIKHSDLCISNADALKAIKAGFEYGFAIVRLNAPEGATYDSWVTWGDGVCGPQDNADRCGTNVVKLSDDPAVIIEEATDDTEAATDGSKDESTSAATSDLAVVGFAALAVISLAGVVVAKKVK